MAWKRFRPSVLRTVCQSMCIGILISLLSAVILSLFYIMISYISSEPMRNWQFHPKETPPVKIQWIRELPDVIGVAFLYMWFFAGMLFLFNRMNDSLLIEFFARVLFSFTRGVKEHYDPDEPEVEILGYNDSLSCEGREWNCRPVDKPIYREYSPPSDDEYYLSLVGNSRVRYRVTNTISPDEDGDEQQNEDDEMAWKRFRPSVLRTVCQSMYIGTSISLPSAVILGLFYVMIGYVSYETTRNCQFHTKETIPVKMQWIRTLSDVIGVAFLYMWFFVGMLFLFRPYQSKGVKENSFLLLLSSIVWIQCIVLSFKSLEYLIPSFL